jgi:hypothetical protein
MGEKPTRATNVRCPALQTSARSKGPQAAEYDPIEIAPELTEHGLPLSKCEAYNRVYDQF